MKDTEIDKIDKRYTLDTRIRRLWIIICVIIPILITIFMIFLNLHFRKQLNIPNYIVLALVILHIFMFVTALWFLIHSILKTIIFFIADKKTKSFLVIYFQRKNILVTNILLLLTISNLLKLLCCYKDVNLKTDDFLILNHIGTNNFYKTLDSWIKMLVLEDKIVSGLLLFTVFFFVILFENIIRYYVQFSIYHQCFRKNLHYNLRNMKCLRQIEKKKEGNTTKTKLSDHEITDIYDFITSNDYITYSDIQGIVNDEIRSQTFFDLFDINNDGKITKSEFLIRYKEIQQQFYNFIIAYKKSRRSITKLKYFTFPIGLYLGISLISTNGTNNSVGCVFASFASLSFIIGPALTDLFKNILLIFFSRPFDVGDTIFFSGKRYLVKDLGFLYSELEHAGSTVYIANESFKKDEIVNLRNSTMFRAKIKIYFRDMFENEKVEQLKQLIGDFLSRNKNIYSEKFKLDGFVRNENGNLCDLNVFIFMYETNFKNIEVQKQKLINYVIKYKNELNLQFMV